MSLHRAVYPARSKIGKCLPDSLAHSLHSLLACPDGDAQLCRRLLVADAIVYDPPEQQRVLLLEVLAGEAANGEEKAPVAQRVRKILRRGGVHAEFVGGDVPMAGAGIVSALVLQRLHQPAADIFVVGKLVKSAPRIVKGVLHKLFGDGGADLAGACAAQQLRIELDIQFAEAYLLLRCHALCLTSRRRLLQPARMLLQVYPMGNSSSRGICDTAEKHAKSRGQVLIQYLSPASAMLALNGA